MTCLIAILFSLVLALPQQANAYSSDTITGRTVDENSRPVPQARIQLWPQGTRVRSDKQGYFTLSVSGNANGNYVYARKDGYFVGCANAGKLSEAKKPKIILVTIPVYKSRISPFLFGSSYWYPYTPAWKTFKQQLEDAAINMLHLGGMSFDGGTLDWDEHAIDSLVSQCRELDAEPLMQVRLYGGSPTYALEMVRYANITMKYGIRFWTIGNEPDLYNLQGRGPYSAMDYAKDFRAYYHAVKQVDPTAVVAGPEITFSHDPKTNEWLRTFLSECGDIVDIVTAHRYPFDGTQSIRQSLNDMQYVETYLTELKEVVQELTGREIPVGITETNLTWQWEGEGGAGSTNSIYAGIWWADFLGKMIKHRLFIASFWSTIGDDTLSWLVPYEYARVFKPGEIRPPYWVQYLYDDFYQHYIPSMASNKRLGSYASADDTGNLVIIIVNSKTKGQFRTRIHFDEKHSADIVIPHLSIIRLKADKDGLIKEILSYGPNNYRKHQPPKPADHLIITKAGQNNARIHLGTPELLSFALKNGPLKSGKNKLSFEIEFRDASLLLDGGRLEVVKTEIPSGKTTRIKIPLEGEVFSASEGRAVLKKAISIGDCEQVILKARLLNSKGIPGEQSTIVAPMKGILPLYDDFDGVGNLQSNGKYLASKGKLSNSLWYLYNCSENVVNKAGHDNVLKIVNSIPGEGSASAILVNPDNMDFNEMQSFQADVYVPSGTDGFFNAGVEFGGSFLINGENKWWGTTFNVATGSWGTSIDWGMPDLESGRWLHGANPIPAKLNSWYTLRMDVKVLKGNRLKFDYFVDGRLYDSKIIEHAKVLLDSENILYGPSRSLTVWKTGSTSEAVAYFDKVRGLYGSSLK